MSQVNTAFEPALLNKICGVVFQSLQEVGKEHHCIDGSALLATVLLKLGIQVYPLTVRVQIFNPAWKAAMMRQKGVKEERNLCDLIEVRLGDEAAATANRWGGHLTVVVPEFFGAKHAVLDLTIGQINRPEHQIEIPPICIAAADAFVTGQVPHPIDDLNGCSLIYRSHPQDCTYGDWNTIMSNPWFERTAAATIARIPL